MAVSDNSQNNHAKSPVMVSVVMISYNQENEISEAIHGVIKQKTQFPIELIISDDASTDATYEIIMNWAKRYPTIIKPYRNDCNVGIQANYLKALSQCRGKYVAMCDGDDYWISPKKLARQVAYMEHNPKCSITFHRMINYYADTHVMSLSNGNQKSDCDINDLACGNFITNASVMYRVGNTDLSNLPGFLKDNTLLDYGLHMFFASQGNIHYFKQPMAVYRKLSVAAWSTQADCSALKMAYNVRKSLIGYFQNNQSVTQKLVAASKLILSKTYLISDENSDTSQWAVREWERVNDNPSDNIETYYKPVSTKFAKKLTSKLRNIITHCLPRPKP
ncbi:MAG: glycosyltransferase [Paramuribaculum sp.]|nr:glycosyltransferase [Paramuribaculum sp.]